MQLAAPDDLRGRLIGLYLFAFVGLAPIGSLVSGWLVEVGGTPLAFSIAGLVGLAATAYAVSGTRERAASTRTREHSPGVSHRYPVDALPTRRKTG